ncbi:uncharacterized protein JCM15063_003226 [Sporobolomyces koalae]|uniref:uncharacterized protein n=1 Tax=Sporobolomyces koalae TaxID=500713 RepID=UPI0031741E88
MDDNTPTHFNVLIVGTGLAESILAAALSKSGYSVLQLDSAPYYGTEHASLSLTELDQWVRDRPERAHASTGLRPDLVSRSQRFALSLFPVLLRASGPGIELLVRSKVATYLQFGLLAGVGLWTPDSDSDSDNVPKAKGKVERVPASKADVFNDPNLSLIEKRRLTKLLLFAASQEPLETDQVLAANPEITCLEYLAKAYNLKGTVAESLAYALALCSSPQDPAFEALQRLRSIIDSVGRYGPSPYLVGHYGGAGDLVGGFSRICAVWGGGQILGRPLLPLDLSPPAGTPVPASQPPFMVHENPPPPPANPADQQTGTRPLGIPVQLEDNGEAPTIFTGDWVISSPHLLPTLFPSAVRASTTLSTPESDTLNLVAILPTRIPFPAAASKNDTSDEGVAEETPASLSDSNLFVVPPKALDERVGTVTALQLGSGTMSCPEGYHVLYLSASLLARADNDDRTTLDLTPYLESLVALAPEPIEPLYTATYRTPASPQTILENSLPANLLVTPTLPSRGKTAGLITTLDEVVTLVEDMFWKIVGPEGKAEGVEFFRKEVTTDQDED